MTGACGDDAGDRGFLSMPEVDHTEYLEPGDRGFDATFRIPISFAP